MWKWKWHNLGRSITVLRGLGPAVDAMTPQANTPIADRAKEDVDGWSLGDSSALDDPVDQGLGRKETFSLA